MKQINILFAALVVAAIVALTPAAHAGACATGTANCHFVGAGSSAQFLTSAIGADQLAINENNAVYGGNKCTFHWSQNNAGNLVDLRNSLIPLEPANFWIVWLADPDPSQTCATSTAGNTNVTDIWLDASVDSTVGVRSFFAALNGGVNGVAVQVIPQATGNLISPASLWPDGRADIANLTTATNVSAAIGTSQLGVANVHVNAGLTDIRPEDALFATTRTMNPLNATNLSGLGYGLVKCPAPNASKYCIGNPILTGRGTGSKANPVLFALSGGDPFNTANTVRPSVTIPVGAAPVVFVYNNNGIALANNPVLNLITNVGNTGTGGGPFSAAKLFDGSTACADNNAAFSGNAAGTGIPISLFIREPLSGTMNTTEYNVFRTKANGNFGDSQERNGTPSAAMPNPVMGLACSTGVGSRTRVIGTGEARDAAKNVANGLSYQFFGFANMSKYGGNTRYNYLTVDGVDPLGGSLANLPQTPPNCTGPCTATAEWTTGPSFPNLRNGTYPVWSLYRWVVESANDGGDLYGPAHLAQSTQDQVNQTISDFVPFCTTSALDGLTVYRSHFKSPLTTSPENNGQVSQDANANICGTSLGGGPEVGGDVGGIIYGEFTVTGTAKYSTATHKFTQQSPLYSTWAKTTSANTNTISIPAASNGPTFAISGSVTTTFAVTPVPTGLANNQIVTYTYTAQTPGVLGGRR